MKILKWLLIIGVPIAIVVPCRHSFQSKKVSAVLKAEETNNAVQNSSKPTEKGSPVLSWDTLRGLDYKTGKMLPEVEKFDGKTVGIPGFAVPIAGESEDKITEILLVPEPMMCIHVPPPPPNQLVHVKLKTPGPVESFVPLLVNGTLKIIKTKSEYGKAGYEMLALSFAPYERDENYENSYETDKSNEDFYSEMNESRKELQKIIENFDESEDIYYEGGEEFIPLK